MHPELAAILEVIDQTPESRLKRERLKKTVLKTYKQVSKKPDFRPELMATWFPPEFRWNLCAARLRMGRYDNWDGWDFRSDWSVTYNQHNGFENPLPKWHGERVHHLVVLGEQGIGDEILFASAIPELIVRLGAGAIEFQGHPRLKRVIERSYGIRVTERKKLTEVTEGDAIVALADLFMFFRHAPEHFPKKPFLKPDPERVEYWKGRLNEISSKPKIGVAWKARHGDLDPKSLMFEDADYINLQYLRHPKGEWIEPLPEGLIDLGVDPLGNIEDHLNLIAALDKVVSVTQTVIHEAGSVGTECHAIRPNKGTGEVDNVLWYYGHGNVDSPVYGSVKIWNRIKDYESWLSTTNSKN